MFAVAELLQSVSNRILLLQLCDRPSGEEFWVANYHMPCKYQNPQAMVTFAALAAQRVQTVSAGDPFIFAGDFNFAPSSSMYSLLTAGTLPSDHPDFPSAPKFHRGKPVQWAPTLQPMCSAYVHATGCEPELTNHATTRYQSLPPKTFTDTLDYLFLSPGWDATNCIQTPTLASIAAVKSFPTSDEPSDHVLIGCSLSRPKSM